MDLITLKNINKIYYIKENFFSKPKNLFALKNFNLSIQPGQTLGIVGESGCGKSTLANLLMGLIKPTSGNIYFHQNELKNLSIKEKLQTQIIFQDPHSSLNPRKKIWQLIAEPLFIHTKLSVKQCKEKVANLLELVGLSNSIMDRYPHMFSGGQKQRIGIARSLILGPKILICDEPVSALDVSVQAQILNLLNDLKLKLDLTLLFISHDLSVVRYFCDQTIVMYLGEIVEESPTERLFTSPKHPYTKALIDSSPNIDDLTHDFFAIKGEIPSPLDQLAGCTFKSRCEFKNSKCEIKPLMVKSKNTKVSFSCHHPLS